MRFAREIRLRRVKCLRTWVDLFHFTLRQSRKISRLPKGKISHRAGGEIFHEITEGTHLLSLEQEEN